MKRIITFLCLTLAVAFSSSAIEVTPSEETKVAVIVDSDSLLIDGMTIEQFATYYAGKYSSNEEYVKVVINRFVQNLQFGLETEITNISEHTKECDLKFIFHLKKITENGGFSGAYTVEYEGVLISRKNFVKEDGRWNIMEVLLNENLQLFLESFISKHKGAIKAINPNKTQDQNIRDFGIRNRSKKIDEYYE